MHAGKSVCQQSTVYNFNTLNNILITLPSLALGAGGRETLETRLNADLCMMTSIDRKRKHLPVHLVSWDACIGIVPLLLDKCSLLRV